MDKKTLNQIIKNHSHWLCKDRDGWEGMRADLHNKDLRDADLHGVDTTCATFLYGIADKNTLSSPT